MKDRTWLILIVMVTTILPLSLVGDDGSIEGLYFLVSGFADAILEMFI